MIRSVLMIILVVLILSCDKNKTKTSNDLFINAEIIGRTSCPGEYDNAIVRITLKNNSLFMRSFSINNCTWEESFRTNNDSITFCMRSCNGNYPIKIDLFPNDSIQFVGVLHYNSPFSRYKSDSFKIGLILLDLKDFYDVNKIFNKKYKESKLTYWSNSVSFDDLIFGYKLKK